MTILARKELERKVEELKAELETERMRLAKCGWTTRTDNY